MDLRINPFDKGNPMTLKDAAVVASVLALVIWILEFLASATWTVIVADPAAFLFECFKTYLVSWAGSFLGLAGLEQYMKRKEPE